jgi:putative ABC transport system permease protein
VLHVPLGGTIEVDDEAGRKVKLRVVALLQESIYQSEVLVSEASFLKLYPRHEGFNFALLDTGALDSAQVRQVQATLQQSLANLGLNVQSTASRVRAYEAVENMYLATFQALGGLGLILGAVGLAIVLLRGVWERRAELALLRALGFRAGSLAWLVLAENLFLLVLGLAAGTLAALLAVAPHLLGGGADVLWLRIGLLLLAVLVVGLGAGLAAVFTTLRAPVLAALQRE